MKKSFILLSAISILFCNLTAKAQLTNFVVLDTLEYLIHYDFTWQRDSTNQKTTIKEPMVLQVGQNLSVFHCLTRLKVEETLKQLNSIEDFIAFMKNNASQNQLRPNTNFYIVTNFNDKTIITQEVLMNHSYEYLEDLNSITWEISTETKIFRGYTMQKANTNYAGRNWTAWFTTDIPISAGPYKFVNLPGLVVSAYDSQEFFHFSLTGIEQNPKDNFIEADEYKSHFIPTQLGEYIKIRNKHFNNILLNMDHPIITDNPAMKEKAIQGAQFRNNFIERRSTY